MDTTFPIPGRFANAVHKSTTATHALQLVRDAVTSCVVLELADDGTATLVRGHRAVFTNDGPEVHTAETVREQLGYRGRWTADGGGWRVELTRDDTVCPPVGEYTYPPHSRAATWELRCSAGAWPGVPTPVLVCEPSDAAEAAPHAVGGVIVLAAGNGVRFTLTGYELGVEPPAAASPAADPIRTDDWNQ